MEGVQYCPLSQCLLHINDGREPKTEQIMEMMAGYNKLTKRLPASLALVWKQDYRLSIFVNKDRWASSSSLYKIQIT